MDAATTLNTTIFDANYDDHEHFVAFFFNYGNSFDEANISGDYYAGRVPVDVNEERADHAVNYTNTSRGQGTVDLTYLGTTTTIIAYRAVAAGVPFKMCAAENGSSRIAPFQYQWYNDEVAFGSPTPSECIKQTLFDVGTTVAYKVEVTDASGLTTTAKHTVDVVETCDSTNPDCGPVEQQ